MTDNFVTFTFPMMKTSVNKSGIEKKIVKGMPTWGDITKENMTNFNNAEHGSTGIITGEKSEITVMDFDSQESYDILITQYPELSKIYTVKTPNGFHLYFKYDPTINTTTNACINIPNIDIRNDGALVIAPPTTYILKNKTVVSYTKNDGTIIEFPEYLKPHLKQFKPSIEKSTKKLKTPVSIPIASQCQPDTVIPNEADKLFIDAIIESGLITHLSTNYMDWIKIGFIFKHTLGQMGIDLFHKFSKLSPEYNEVGTTSFWNTPQTYTGKQVTLATLKKLAKDKNETTYKFIHDECYPKEKKISKHEQGNADQIEQYSNKEKLWRAKVDRGDIETLPDGRKMPFFLGMYDGVMNDLDAVTKLMRLYPYFKYCHKILYAFNFTNGLWTSDKSGICGIITMFESYLHIMNNIDGAWIMSEFKSYGNCLNLIEIIYSLIKTRCVDNDWLKNNENSGLSKLLFPNGWYDFATSTFYNKTEYSFNPDIVFFSIMPYAFEPFSDDDLEYMETIKQRLFYSTTSINLGNYFILMLARGLSGECMKEMIFAIGDTNCGKGVITMAISHAIGSYFGAFNGECIALKDTSADEAQQLRWVMLVAKCRIIISNEMKHNIKLSGNIIKKIVSGKEPMVARTHGGEETVFITHFLPIIFSNDMNEIFPYQKEEQGRTKCIGFTKHYVSHEPTTDLELPMDPNIKQEVVTKRFSQCLVGIFLMEYSKYVENGKIAPICLEAENSKNTWITEEKADPINLFLEDYIFTNNDADFIHSSSIDSWMKTQENIGVSPHKLRLLIKQYADTNKLSNVYNKTHKISKKQIVCWHGIIRRTPQEEDEEDEPK
jgi:hypothetical protein